MRVRPGLPLDMQLPRDLLWIRAPFLRSEEDFGKRVVHGHTIVRRPEVKANRIGIDTGAFHSGHLTCLARGGDDPLSPHLKLDVAHGSVLPCRGKVAYPGRSKTDHCCQKSVTSKKEFVSSERSRCAYLAWKT